VEFCRQDLKISLGIAISRTFSCIINASCHETYQIIYVLRGCLPPSPPAQREAGYGKELSGHTGSFPKVSRSGSTPRRLDREYSTRLSGMAGSQTRVRQRDRQLPHHAVTDIGSVCVSEGSAGRRARRASVAGTKASACCLSGEPDFQNAGIRDTHARADWRDSCLRLVDGIHSGALLDWAPERCGTCYRTGQRGPTRILCVGVRGDSEAKCRSSVSIARRLYGGYRGDLGTTSQITIPLAAQRFDVLRSFPSTVDQSRAAVKSTRLVPQDPPNHLQLLQARRYRRGPSTRPPLRSIGPLRRSDYHSATAGSRCSAFSNSAETATAGDLVSARFYRFSTQRFSTGMVCGYALAA